MDRKTWQYISDKSGEEILEWRGCKWTWEDFPIFKKEADILDKISPVIKWKKYNLPLPNISPRARNISKMIWRNERHLYKRKCDLTWDDIISVFHPDYEWQVYNFKDYSSDKFNPFDYWISIDFSKSIFENYKTFYENISKRSVNIWETDMENCDYCNYGSNSQNCYMCQCPVMSEKCFYSFTPLYSKYSIDSHFCEKCEITYESISCSNSFKVFYCQDIEDSSDCYFCFDLKNCQNCIWCVWIEGKKYYLFNKEIWKDKFENKLKEIFSSYETVENFKIEYEKFQNKFSKKNLKNRLEENCFWNNVISSQNVINGHNCIDLQDSFNSSIAWIKTDNLINCHSVWLDIHYAHEVIWASYGTKFAFCIFASWNNSYYLSDSRNINNSIFSLWLLNQEYCIFNKKYTKEDYENHISKIIEKMQKYWEWWKFFPSELSPFPYNDSIANDYYPVKEVIYLDSDKKIIKKDIYDEFWIWVVYVLNSNEFISEAILDLWWEEKIKIKWRTKEIETYIPDDIEKLTSEIIPEISEVSDDILWKVIICEKSLRPFKIIKEELYFYKKYNLPIPRLHPEERYRNRFNKIPKYDLFLRKCNKCNEETLSTIEKWKIICEKCV